MKSQDSIDEAGRKKLEILRSDYLTVRGHAFNYFYCPVTHVDQEVELCRGHIINEAFAGSSRAWTIQRKDVDNFFGAHFESDFVDLQHKDKYGPLDALTDKHLGKRFRPRISFKGRRLEYYKPTGTVPKDHSEVLIGDDQREVRVALKLEPTELIKGSDADWSIDARKDLRLPALVSLLKMAHLTMFDMLGYRYVLSAGGYFLGHDILGKFFSSNSLRDRRSVITAARKYFREFAALVRPALSAPPDFAGTVTDRQSFVCLTESIPWAVMVLVKTGEHMNGVLVPVFDDPEGAARFVRFLKSPAQRIQVRLTKYSDGKWLSEVKSRTFNWPEAHFEG